MGILNVTPDSFSDGGRFADLTSARAQAMRMAEQGASIIDVGGESTRPGAAPVGDADELDRVIPVVEAVVAETGLPVSIDTSKPIVMREAVSAGAAMINDVLALRADGAISAAAALDVPVCLMHMQGEPRTMQKHPCYDDVVSEVGEFLEDRIVACESAGIRGDRLVIDPGFGFGKSHQHNLQLLAGMRTLRRLGKPILAGLSRKSTLGEITGRDTDGRLAGSIAAAVIAVQNGATIVRAHDVAETVDALRVATSVMEAGNE